VYECHAATVESNSNLFNQGENDYSYHPMEPRIIDVAYELPSNPVIKEGASSGAFDFARPISP